MVANQVSIMKFILLLILIQFTSAQKLVRLSSSIERASLLELRSSLGLRTTDWPIKTDPCLTWIGVQCGTNNGRVIGINVSGLKRTRIGRLNPLFSVDSLSNFTHLTSFNASGFLLPGSIPHLFGQNLQSLQVLDLRSCSVTDPIPFSIGNLSNLNSLYLSGNGITGIIPETLGQLSKLSILDLSQNLLTGSIPSSFASLTNITHLDLSSNFLSGPIPPTLGGLKKLVFLDLSNNSLSASIPGELGDLSGLVNLDLSTNSLSGSLPLELKGMRSLKRMGLGHNNLDGSLPVSLWSMPELVFLDVSYNNFTGVLPHVSLSSSNADQRVFNLSNNQFYGNLSSGIGAFSFIDLSVNYFQGKVDNNNNVKSFYLASNCLQNVLNQRSMEECSLFYVDKGLVLEKFGQPNASQPPKRALGRRSKKKLIFILVGVLGGLCFLVLLVLLLVVWSRKRETSANDERRGSTSPAVGETPGPLVVSKDFSHVGELFTYEQLLRATGDFSDSNLIKHGHSGDLFRGVLEGGTLVVVKRVEVHSVKKETYLGELELFSKISHTRLVPFLGHCFVHENEKLLVYKYMPNGDLSTSLYRKSSDEDENLHTLDWITRLKIAIGAAEGLSYLHHECSPPLVHRDVQASSILLDDKFEVRLGSLSEICSQEGDTQQGVITRLLRLPQNSEQGTSSVPSSETCAYDVYCFGKVLLELVTGRLGISSSNDETVDEWLEITLQCISLYEKELITKIVDSTLIIDDDLLEEVWAMAIVAKSCLHPKPSKRPLMRYVLKALENPLKVVREENSGSDRLKGSWNASVFGSWRHSSTEITIAPTLNTKEEVSSFKQSGAISSQGSRQSGAGELLSSNKKKLSGDIFPEPSHLPDY